MNEEYMKTMYSIRHRMWKAHYKADKASQEYNDLVEQLSEAERISWASGLYDKEVIDLRSSLKSETFRPLKSAYNHYIFWKGELERLSALLVGENAFEAIHRRGFAIESILIK